MSSKFVSSNAFQKNGLIQFLVSISRINITSNPRKRPTLSLINSSKSNYSFRSQLIHFSSVSSSYELVHEYHTIAEIGEGHFVCTSSGVDLLCFYQTGYVGKIWLCNPMTKKTLSLPILSHFVGQACLGYVSNSTKVQNCSII